MAEPIKNSDVFSPENINSMLVAHRNILSSFNGRHGMDDQKKELDLKRLTKEAAVAKVEVMTKYLKNKADQLNKEFLERMNEEKETNEEEFATANPQGKGLAERMYHVYDKVESSMDLIQELGDPSMMTPLVLLKNSLENTAVGRVAKFANRGGGFIQDFKLKQKLIGNAPGA